MLTSLFNKYLCLLPGKHVSTQLKLITRLLELILHHFALLLVRHF